MEKEIHYNIAYKNKETFSDSTYFVVEDIEELKEAIDNMRTGVDGTDIEDIEYISFWDNEGNEY